MKKQLLLVALTIGIIVTTQAQKVNIGMTRDSVITILGPPDYSNTTEHPESNSIFTTDIYEHNIDNYYIKYVNNTVIEIKGAPKSYVENNKFATEKTTPVLYKGNDIHYYQETARKALRTRNAGIVLTVLGTVAEIGGYIMMVDDNYNNDNLGAGLYLGGAISSTIGIPLWISGAIKHSNNKKAIETIHIMERQNKIKTTTYLGFTQNGFGLVLKF